MNRRAFLRAGLGVRLRTGAAGALAVHSRAASRRTRVAIQADEFHLNGRPTYQGRSWQGMKIQGLLMNSRMVQGIFDDSNPATMDRWRYPDTGRWDPDRNTREFVAAMPLWRSHGLLGFTIGLQGGSPEGYSKEQPWRNSAFRPDGSLRADYMARLEKILDRADELGMVPIVGLYYFGQDEHMESERAIRRGVQEALGWLLGKGYDNILVEIANECDNRKYEQEILRAANIHELIRLARSVTANGKRCLVGASFNGGSIPSANVVRESDFLLVHGNGVKDPQRIAWMVEQARQVQGYRRMPVMFNEDDHFEFDKPVNNMLKAIGAYASWGYFDPGKNDYEDGYQSVPVNWGLNTPRKKEFFELLKRVTGS